MTRLSIHVAIILGIAACDELRWNDDLPGLGVGGELPCGERGECPTVFYCAPDDRCWRRGHGPDMTLVGDAGISDARACADDELRCGGACEPCPARGRCRVDRDCESLVCRLDDLRCAMNTCSDGVKNGAETDIDCGRYCRTTGTDAGGPAAKRCAPGQGCEFDSDCRAGLTCSMGRCR